MRKNKNEHPRSSIAGFLGASVLLFVWIFQPLNKSLPAAGSSFTEITYLGHATLLIEMDGVRLLTDPVLQNRVLHLNRLRGEIDPQNIENIDAVLISHAHWDHLDIGSLKLLDPDTLFIVPHGVDTILWKNKFHNIQVLSPGESTTVGGVSITATQADHDGARYRYFGDELTVGYLIDGLATIYFAGDTDIYPEMVDMAGKVDVALLPVWGWGPTLGGGHLDPAGAAAAARMIQPKVVIPIHWGTYFPLSLQWFMRDVLTQPPITFKREAAKLAPDVNVIILPPGESRFFDCGS